MALAIVSVALGAKAQEGEPSAEGIKQAAQAFDLGRESYKLKDWVVAAEQFEAADSFAPSKAALELAIRARDKADQLDRAATLCALGEARHPDAPDLLDLCGDIVKRANTELGRLHVSCDEACALVIDSKLVHGRPANERTLYLNPGMSASLRASWSENRTEEEIVAAAAGETREVLFSAAPLPVAEPDDEIPRSEPLEPEPPIDDGVGDVGVESRGGWSPAVFWVGAGLTAVAGGVTIWSGIDTQNNPGPERVRVACQDQDESCPEYQEGLSKQRRTNVLAGVTAGLGVLTILVGAVATDWGGSSDTAKRSEASRPTRAGVTPWVAVGGGAMLGATGRF
jgi:hypothetical protein